MEDILVKINNFITKMQYLKKDFAEDRAKAQKIVQQWRNESPKIHSIKKPSYRDPKDPFAVRTIRAKNFVSKVRKGKIK